MKLSRMKLKLIKHAPEIMMGVGMVSIGAGVYLACKATLSLEDVLDRHKDLLEEVKSVPEQVNPVDNVEMSEKDMNKAITKVWAGTIFDIFKLYAPAAGCLLGGSTLVIGGFSRKYKECVQLTAAFETLNLKHKKLRQAVIDDQGKEKYHEYMYGKGKKKTVEMQTVNDDGETVYEKKQAVIMEDGVEVPLSAYAQMFARGISSQWDSNEYYNRSYILGRQEWWSTILRKRGHVYLNEVYESLGFPHTKDGSVIGWVYDPGDPDSVDHIEFDIHEVWLPEVDDAGKPIYEVAYYIDFPDLSGVIFDKI